MLKKVKCVTCCHRCSCRKHNAEFSISDIIDDEMELAMVSFAESEFWCADKVATLKVEL